MLSIKNKCGQFSAAMILLFIQADAWATTSLPLAKDAVKKANSLNVFDFAKYIIGGVVGVILLAYSGFAFIQAISAALVAFNDWKDRDGSVQDLGKKVGIAIVMLVIIIVVIGLAAAAFSEYI